jgi:N-acetylmuramoyl-L-alanine amidase
LNDRPSPAFSRLPTATATLGLLLLIAGHLTGQSGGTALTLLSREGRRTIPIFVAEGRESVALDDLASTFQLAVREEVGALTVSYKGKTVVLTPEQALASVAGRLVTLPAPPSRTGGRWMVPLEFISRALAPIYDTRLDLRASSHLLVVGDLRVPHVAIRYDLAGGGARLTLDATPRATSSVTQDGDHLTIRFDADSLDVAVPAVQLAGPVQLVQALRVADAATVTVDLGPRFSGFRASTQQTDAGTRLVIDLAGLQADATAPTPAPPPAPAPDLPGFGQAVSTVRTIVIDPGHGGKDAGVRGTEGTQEKEVTLSVARRAKAAIEGRLGIRVLLTRDDDRNVPLEERTAVANNNKADLFLSLHVNGALRTATRGASIYVAEFSSSDQAEAAISPARVPIFGGGLRDIELVPWDLAQLRHVDQSTVLAHILERELQDRVPLDVRPVDRAPFRVLAAANMPAILVELGYLTNLDQEQQLGTAEFQTAFVQAISDAVVKFSEHLSGENGADR